MKRKIIIAGVSLLTFAALAGISPILNSPKIEIEKFNNQLSSIMTKATVTAEVKVVQEKL
ncbi:MAG: hypothetical protein KC493_03930 [Bacteriovoracaceae bacterium]|nr:hypothetical protein [Bacteriovoracaceae bacterium]